MTLYLDTNDEFTQWSGERINGILYPLNIEQLWTADELKVLNLYIPQSADEVPEGKIVTETTVQRVGEVVKYVNTLEDYVEPVPDTVSRRQAKLALHDAELLSLVEPALQALQEPQKTAAIIEWEDATEFHRNHGLLVSLAAALNLTDEQVDNLFIEASKL